MGTALIVSTIPEEALDQRCLFDSDGIGNEFLLKDHYGERWWEVRFNIRELHPNAYYRFPTRLVDVWHLPAEPRHRGSLDWHEDPKKRAAHCAAVRASLEEFLNGRLKRLNHMVRTGWWVLGEVKIRVTKCRPVPEYEMRAFAKAFKKLRVKKITVR